MREYPLSAPQLLELIEEQKRVNQEIVKRLEAVNTAPSLTGEIRYLKVLLNSSSVHILNSLTEVTKQISKYEEE
ncbi:hypothetical protein PJ311_02855 [Bacillus sp. CLL-7-23]|uniref:Uncharacterized protein n=1 Tax=Bacillus changyiensis TaxID=3004103 RepID=A0ABT4WZS7_9BACI|nr:MULTISPECIES: hypothetical protein [Bacillus]MDA7025549.1 hypothetical protein [Bacillus changyiensis]NPC94289.1 hypothetical protein [Bacillus sp. WMMC1349]